MRINHLTVTAEYRKQRESTNQQTGAVTRVLTFEDSDCNTFDVNVREVEQFAICNGMVKGDIFVLELALTTGISRSGSHYEMLYPALPDFASPAE